MQNLVEQLRDAIIEIAGPAGLFDSRQRQIERAAHRCAIPERTAKALFYGEIKDPKHSLAATVFAARDRLKKASTQDAAIAQEILELRARLDRLERAISAQDGAPARRDPLSQARPGLRMRGA